MGYVFKKGEFDAGVALQAVAADGLSIPLQVDTKARHRDGSIRHAVLTGFLPVKLKSSTWFEIVKADDMPDGEEITLDQVRETGLGAEIRLRLENGIYTLSLQSLLKRKQRDDSHNSLVSRVLAATRLTSSMESAKSVVGKQWLAGPLVSEWIIGGPLSDKSGELHDHLAGYFHLRAYRGMQSIRIDMVVENNWTFQKGARNFQYDVEMLINGKSVDTRKSLTHFHHARWHKVFWIGIQSLPVVHNVQYLQATGAISRYMDLRPDLKVLHALIKQVEPMSNGPLQKYMPTTGASPAIGPLPRWAALYAVSGDPDAFQATLAGGDAGGTYSIHYRDRKTGLPVSIAEYPDLSLNGGTMPPRNREFGGNIYSHDQAHQPSVAYLPYLISGDYFYLEELQFWANWDMLWSHNVYRQREKGIIGVQVRGQAWALREIARAAYITPDDHPLKQYFHDRVLFNIDYNTDLYVNNPDANKLGALRSYDGYKKFAPWMDDFYTWMTGHLVELGFIEAKPLRDWKARFPVERMGGTGNNGYCYIHAATYRLVVGPAKDQWWPDFATLYRENFTDNLNAPCRDGLEMEGYAHSPTGFPSNLRPALAIAVDAGVAGAESAWKRFVSSAVQPDYSNYPNFALQPRVPLNQEGIR